MKSRHHKILLFAVFSSVILSFQNCTGPGFVATGELESELSQGSSSLSLTFGSAKTNPFGCAGKIASDPIRRLTRLELENTLKNMLGDTIYQSLKPQIGNLYSDQISLHVREFTQQIDDAQMGAYGKIAEKILEQISASSTALTSLGYSCAQSTITTSCVESIIQDLGLKAFRRPLTSAELTNFRDVVYPMGANGLEGIGWVAYTMVLMPDFLMHVQLGTTNATATEVDLSPFEVASRISYLIGDSPPDAELFAAAKANKLSTEEQIFPHVDRLFTKASARDKVHRFFEFWVKPKYLTAAGLAPDFLDGFDVASGSAEFIREMNEFIDYVVFTKQGTLKDLILGREAFPRLEAVANVMGTKALPANMKEPTQTSPDRVGLLMRPAVLATEGNETHPILRGVKFRSRFLCQVLGLPAGAILVSDASFASEQAKVVYSTRHRTEKLTSSTTCMACHSRINPVGFAFENYDNFGRLRSHEKTYSSTNALLATHAVSSEVEMMFNAIQGNIRVQSPGQMINEIMSQNQLPGCFATQMHRFYRLRLETAGDGCVLQEVYDSLMVDTKKSLLDAFKRQVVNKALQKRRID